jgi:hypothetical protein
MNRPARPIPNILLALGLVLLAGCRANAATPGQESQTALQLIAAATPAALPTFGGIAPTPMVTPDAGPDGALPTPTLAVAVSASPIAPPPATLDMPPPESRFRSPTLVPPPATRHSPPPFTATPAATATAAPTATPALAPPLAVAVNGVPFESIIVMPPEVVARAREIFATGQAIGRNPHAFAKVGDSTTENPHFLARFDEGPYNLGDYAHLQPVIDQFRGSFNRDSVAVRIGLHAWTANDPAWADAGICLPNETPVQCEIRLHNPSIILIRLGTNDVGVGGMFEANIRQIIDTAIAAGVVPVIGTKGDRHEGSNENNDILRRLAAEYRLPLWDYDRVADTLPGRGLDVDAAHMMTFYAHDYADPTAFTRGHAMHNLTALMVLDAVWRATGGG